MKSRLAETASRWRSVLFVLALAAPAALAQTGQTTDRPQAPQTGQAKPESAQGPVPPSAQGPVPAFAVLGPSREIKLAEFTWFRFGAQVQAWFRDSQDRIRQPDGSDGGYAYDFYCRRCRFFATGSVVRNVFFNVLFEASNLGRADPITGAKSFAPPSILDAYGQVKFADAFWLSGGSILLPLTRNGTQPTTTYVSIDNANVDTSPILQGNTNVIRDLGFQANGFFAANHVEYRLGVFQGSRAPERVIGARSAAGACTPPACTLIQTAGHNPPRFVAYLLGNFWDPETGYVNGGHYFGAKRVLGVMANFDYQILRNQDPSLIAGLPAVGASKNPYYGISGATFINYPLSGTPSSKGGDEFVGLLQFGYYDGGLRQTGAAPTNVGTYPNVLQQTNYLAEAGYYNHGARFSVFGKFEMRKISGDYPAALQATQNQWWLAGGVKYYVAPFNLLNFALQYERNNFFDADKVTPAQQSGLNSVTFQMQLLLY
jgi:hypothetical protein